MRKQVILYVTAIIVAAGSCSQNEPEGLVLVKGGTFINTKSNLYGKNALVTDFYIGKYEVTQKEWIEIMGSNPSEFKGDDLPVETVSWYDCIEYCNKRSLKEGLKPYYIIDKNKKDLKNTNDIDSIKWTVTFNTEADGYRLPTEAEWEYAAGGGQMSRSYKYSGSNDVDTVAWYWQNSGDKYLSGVWSVAALEGNHNKSKPVGCKKTNELGIYDMSGNVREWCEDWYEDRENNIGIARVWRGGGWIGADFCCESSFRIGHEANGKGPDQGFRVCRNR
jgi:formylglycine-generating enzyme required for sulfatase activity